MSDKFPNIKKSIQDFFDDEDGSITRNKVLTIGGMVIVMGMILGDEVFASHRTHYTHRTHSTHRTSNGGHGSHSSSHNNHSNHYTHDSHNSHASHVSYSDRTNYGSTETQSGDNWPSLSDIESINKPTQTSINTSEISDVAAALNSINDPQQGAEGTSGNIKLEVQIPPSTPNIKK